MYLANFLRLIKPSLAAAVFKNVCKSGHSRRFSRNVKKVRTPPLYGLDPGEIAFGDSLFRLKKSLK